MTAEDGSVPFVVLGIPGIKSFFLTLTGMRHFVL